MHTFEITIQRQHGERCPVIAEERRDDGSMPIRVENTLRLDQNELIAAEQESQAYGALLGHALFSGTLRDAFVEALARAEERLRVLLFVEDQSMRALRWERLQAPAEGGWKTLATYQRAPLSRYLPSMTDRRFPPIGRQDLRALVVAASPGELTRFGLEHFDVQAATAGVRAALGNIPTTLLADLPQAQGRPTLDQICERITAEPYSLLHLVAHGRVLKDGESVIYLAGGESPDSVDPVSGTRLLERLSALQGARGLPHFAFLSTCESASPDADEALGGLGQRLVRELGMPAVIAMTEKVTVTTALALAAEVYRRLGEHGEPDRALVEATAGLAERGDVLVPVLFSRLGGRPLFSDALGRPLTPTELGAGLERLAALLAERAPVLEGEFGVAAGTLRRTLATRPEMLTAETRKERTAALEQIEAICGEACELSFEALALGQSPPTYDARCPFPGLRSFSADARQFFFGREPLVRRLLGRMSEHPLLAVLGPSGSGKSSVVFAGLAPALEARQPGLKLVRFTPGELPLANMLYALEQAGMGGPAVAPRSYLLVVDQFEEAFTLCTSPEERTSFFGELLRLAGPQQVVLIMRADFLGEVAPYAELRDAIQSRQELVAPMTPEELRRAIELQAAAVGLRFEADLSGDILDDVRGEPGAMPLLQHALQELWQRRRGRWLRGAEYRAIGGIQQAIAHSADEIYERCSREDQERLRGIFVRLTRLDRDGGEQQRDTRQRVLMGELVPVGDDPAPTRALVARLADARLLVTSSAPGGEDLVEVAHEALIRGWPRLRNWLSEDRASLLLHEAVRQAAREWAENQSNESFLWSGVRLAQTELLAQQPRFRFNTQEQTFLDAAVAARQRTEKEAAAQLAREKQLRAEAEQQRDAAERLRVLAEQSQHEAEQQRTLAEQSQQEAVQQRDEAERQRAFAQQSQQEAVQQREDARQQRDEAIVQRTRAEQSQHEADSQRGRAEEQSRVALAQRNRAQRFAIGAGIGLLLTILASAFAVWQLNAAVAARVEADTNARRANQQALIADARAALGRGDGERALALAMVAANNDAASPEAFYTLAESADDAARRVLARQPGVIVNAVAFAPDGQSALAGWSNGALGVWNVLDGTQIYSTTLDGGVNTALFSADGANAIVGTDRGQVLVTGTVGAQPLPGSDDIPITNVALSPDGALVAAGNTAGTLRIWRLADRTLQQTVQLETAENSESPPFVGGLAFAPSGSALLVAGDDATLRMVAVADGQETGRWKLVGDETTDIDGDDVPDACYGSALTTVGLASELYLFVGCYDGRIQLWQLEDDELNYFNTYTGHEAEVLSLATSSDQTQLLSSSLDQSVLLWDINSAQIRDQYAAADGEVYGVAFNSDSSQLLTGSFQGTVRLWDTLGGQRLSDFAPEVVGKPGVIELITAPDNLLSAGYQRDSTEGNVLFQIPSDGSEVKTIALPGKLWQLSGDGLRAAIGQIPDTLTIWDAQRGASVGEVAVDPEATLNIVVLNQDGTQLLLAQTDQPARLITIGGAERELSDLKLTAGAFSADNSRLAVANNKEIKLYDLASSSFSGDFVGHSDEVSGLAFSKDGTRLISGSYDRTVIVWDVATQQPIWRLTGHTNSIRAVVFSDDGALALSGSDDKTMRLWDIASGQELATYGSHRAAVLSVAFIPRPGDLLAVSGTGETELVYWKVLAPSQLTDWVRQNRFVAELGCDELARYGRSCESQVP